MTQVNFKTKCNANVMGLYAFRMEKQRKVRNSETLISQSGFRQRTRLEQKFALIAL